jgi:hypothetical protein
MIKKNQEIEIDENDIFKNDKLNRKESIKDLSKLLISNTEPLVLSINASWGSGKTTFVKLWQTYLKKECNINSIYFSAWEDDFSKEPLISILGEMNNYIESNFGVNTAVPKGFKKALNLSGKILKRGVPIAIKGATVGLIDAPQIIEDTISAISEESVKTLIENYSDDKNILIEFKKAIEKVLNEMDEEKPFIIFIDELDRCRPLYSIELLERIKHVFGIRKLIFVLSIDKLQLCESIKSQYGNINANSYLKRFIDLEYNLINKSLDEFCDFLYLKFDLENLSESKCGMKEQNDNFHHLYILKKLAHIFKFTLRDIEQVFTKIDIVFKTIEPNSYVTYFRIFIFFEMLKSYDSKIYYDFIDRKISSDKIKEIVHLDKFKDENLYQDVGIFFEAIIDSTRKTDEELKELIKNKEIEQNSNFLTLNDKRKSWETDRTQTSLDEYRFIQSKYNRLENLINTLRENNYSILIDKIIKKIEFADKFNFDTV